jgi:hypothetical protein
MTVVTTAESRQAQVFTFEMGDGERIKSYR